MSPDDLLVLLGDLTDARFAEAAELLSAAARNGARVSVASGLISSAELRATYAARRDRCQDRGVRVPGIVEFVDVLAERPGASWRIIAVSDEAVVGAVFVADSGEPAACLAGAASEPERQ